MENLIRVTLTQQQYDTIMNSLSLDCDFSENDEEEVLLEDAMTAMKHYTEIDREEKVISTMESILSLLPHEPDYRIWSDNDEILCETENLAENIADLIDALYGEQTVNTGFYDPEEDVRNNEVTETTGWYYVSID